MTSPLSTLSPEVLQGLFDHLPDVMFFVKDREGRYLLVNRLIVRRCGKRRSEEVLGRTVEFLFPGAFGRNTTQDDLMVVARGEAIEDKLEQYQVPGAGRADAEESAARWCLSTRFPLRDEEGRVVGVVGVSRDLPRPDERSGMYRQLARVVAYVEAHYGEVLRSPELARVAGLSEDRLERGTREVFGVTPKQLVLKIRLEAASRWLRTSEMSVAEVAHACGYADHSAFTRQFRSVMGLTPTQYRGL